MSTGLPTREEMLRNARADLQRARLALSDARDQLNSDWQPVGTSLTETQSAARTAARNAIGTCKDEIDAATDALNIALRGGAR